MKRNATRRRILSESNLSRLLDALEPRRLFAVSAGAGVEAMDATASTTSLLLNASSNVESNDEEVARSTAIAPSTPYRADRFWANLDTLPAARRSNAILGVNATNFQPFSLDASRMRQKLDNAAKENLSIGLGEAAQTLEVSVPTPEGTLARFNIVESSVMAPELQAQFPDIRTYAGFGVDDPSAYIRLDFTQQGFHATVRSGDTSFYVDPYYHLDQSVYASYYRRDAVNTNRSTSTINGDDVIDVGALAVSDPEKSTSDAGPEATTGTILRTYRLAMAATGGYTQFQGGTVALGTSAIVTMVNRLNTVYETDLTIRLQLIANNSTIVYTNPATDPYTYESGGASGMLGQNQSNLDTNIGNANYDVGHVVDRITGGGDGVAGLGVVGVAGSKARGVTGFDNPINDPFVIDFVAHELGHQYGANHTYNSNANAFVSGQRNPSTAYEPGSGSTVMSYAGITGPNSDLQSNSDAYFHFASADEILNLMDGARASIGTRTATGNSVPTANAGANFTIPTGTPFILTGAGTDANGDTLTYTWEQRDLGAGQILTSGDNGASPLFRSFTPTTNPVRMFPRLSTVLAGQTFDNAGERLPTLARTMDFRLTVRDNRTGGGGSNVDDMFITVVSTGAAFAITSQNAGGTFAANSSQNVTWNVAGTTGSGINTANVKISLSTDGGVTFPTVLAASTPNDGSESITIPNANTTQARIKVEAVGNIFFDINNANFAITPQTSPTPGAPQLLAASDTGVSNSDLITRLNNSNVANILQFDVPNTVAGATVELLVGGVVVGSAVATGTTTTISTNGTQIINNGSRSFTARQTESGFPVSAQSAAQVVLIDFTRPVGTPVAFDRLIGPHQIQFTFSENVGPTVAGSDLVLDNITNGASNGPASVSYNSGTNTATFTYNTQPVGILANGRYETTISSSAITDIAGNTLNGALADAFLFLMGDSNGDADVDLDDFTALAANFGQSPRNFAQGDFNYSGAVDLDDFTLLAANFGSVLPGSLARTTPGAFSNEPIAERDERMMLLIDDSNTGAAI